jgi:LSD1 subclass zinc finger protein
VEEEEEVEEKAKTPHEDAFICPRCQTPVKYRMGAKVVECFSCGEKYKVNFVCNHCGTKIIYPLSAEKFKCPKCGAMYRVKKRNEKM